MKYEPAATEALADGKPAPVWEDEKLLFPHLYGTINYDAVVDTLVVVRSHCGRWAPCETRNLSSLEMCIINLPFAPVRVDSSEACA